MRKFLAIFVILILCSCSYSKTSKTDALSTAITPQDIQTHIHLLDADSLGTREIGTSGAAIAARYISDHFKQFGLQPLGDDSTYYQELTVNTNDDGEPAPDFVRGEKHITRNVVAKIKGADQPTTYIIIGAHYNYYSQVDNVSGVSGLMELAQYFSAHQLKKSLLFITFSGEDMSQFGAPYFVDHPLIPLHNVQAMINLNDLGELTKDGLKISGTATSKNWASLIHRANSDSLTIKTIPDGVEKTSFYDKRIPVLTYNTDASSGDIDAKGEAHILEHLKRLVMELDTLQASSLSFDSH